MIAGLCIASRSDEERLGQGSPCSISCKPILRDENARPERLRVIRCR